MIFSISRPALVALALLTAGCSLPEPIIAPIASDPTLSPERAINPERVINAEAGEYVTATINGKPMKLGVAINLPGAILLNTASAKRAGLRGSMSMRSRLAAGPILVNGKAQKASVVIDGRKQDLIISWFERDQTGEADGINGVISSLWMPENRITFLYHRPVAGERTIEFPIEHYPYAGPGGQVHTIELGGQFIRITFSPLQPLSMATAAAAAHLATMQDGYWTGEARPMPVLLGIERPVRPMTLRRPLNLNGLAIQSFLVRTADNRGDFQLPSDEPVDPAEIVVTGKTTNGRASLQLTLGQDVLGGCSSITHDKARKMMVLNCLLSATTEQSASLIDHAGDLRSPTAILPGPDATLRNQMVWLQQGLIWSKNRRNISLTLGRKDGVIHLRRCGIRKSSGDQDVDLIPCQAAKDCAVKYGTAWLERGDFERCMEPRMEVLVTELHNRRGARGAP